VLVRWHVRPMFTSKSLASPCLITENHAQSIHRARSLFSNYVIWVEMQPPVQKHKPKSIFPCGPPTKTIKKGNQRDASLFRPIKAAINTLYAWTLTSCILLLLIWKTIHRRVSWKTNKLSQRSLISWCSPAGRKLSERFQLHTCMETVLVICASGNLIVNSSHNQVMKP
jgi:hypothetical protein